MGVCEGSMKPVGGVSGRVQKGSRRGDWANSAHNLAVNSRRWVGEALQ